MPESRRVTATQGSFSKYGLMTITGNAGFGVSLLGGAKAQFGAVFGANSVTGNSQGGVSLQETAEVSFWNGGSQNLIQNNGPVGVTAGLGSQVTLHDDVEISGHSGPGVDLYASSQANLFGNNYIHNNGSSSDPPHCRHPRGRQLRSVFVRRKSPKTPVPAFWL